jgi:alkanesulfonate monooxygenase SsuD/methylene tetrahydromethanopterin reductase-like flavin-dependent oxidoreductase (luciferase family)
MTEVLLSPLRNTTILAKETATLDALSQGRLALVLSTYRKNGRACKKEGRGKEKKQKKRSG